MCFALPETLAAEGRLHRGRQTTVKTPLQPLDMPWEEDEGRQCVPSVQTSWASLERPTARINNSRVEGEKRGGEEYVTRPSSARGLDLLTPQTCTRNRAQ
jgi:hypothetical protein